jgi:nitrate/nitrite-specific signal transduction histidine kinase
MQICEADLRAALSDDREFLKRFSASSHLTADQEAHLRQTCSVFEIGAVTMIQIIREAQQPPAEPLVPGGTPI